MRIGRCAALTALIAGSLTLCESAGAQLGFTVTGRYEAVAQGSGRYGSVALYPLAPFMRAGIFAEGGSGTKTAHGMLFAAEGGYTPPSGRSIELGGWFWSSGDSDVYQIHGKTFFNRELGVQLGWIGSTGAEGNALTLFLIHDLASANVAPDSRRKWGVQTGLGIIRAKAKDPTNVGDEPTSNDFTMFVQGSLEIGKNMSVNLTQWYLRNRITDLNRFALGVGYSF